MDAAYADAYRRLYEEHWWWRAREAFILEVLRHHAPTGGYGRILDVGCGDALFFHGLAEFGIPFGVETDARIVSEGTRSRGFVHVGPLETLPRTEPFGLVVMLDVIEHAADDVQLLRSAGQLAAEGTILVTVPAMPSLWTHHDAVNQHFRRYTRRTLLEIARNAGITVSRCEYFYHWPVAAKLLERVLESVRPPKLDAVTQIPPRSINRALFLVSRLEQKLQRGLRWLPGTSLLLLGRQEPSS